MLIENFKDDLLLISRDKFFVYCKISSLMNDDRRTSHKLSVFFLLRRSTKSQSREKK